jgi:hypothetical protein
MKHILLAISFFLGSISFGFAQENEADPVKREQKVQALYIAYMTQQLNLTEDEAQKFWPVHKLYHTDIKAIDFSKPELQRQQAVLDVKKKYYDRFSKILGNTRTDDFFRKDMEFQKKLIERLRKIRENNPEPRSRRNKD